MVGLMQVTVPSVTVQWDSAGQTQTFPDITGTKTYTFTATQEIIGLLKILPDGTTEANPSYWLEAQSTTIAPFMTAPLNVADAAYLLTGKVGVAPDPTQKFRVAVAWYGWRVRTDDPTTRIEVYSPAALSTEVLTLTVTSTAPMTGTFTVLGGSLPRAPTSPLMILFRK